MVVGNGLSKLMLSEQLSVTIGGQVVCYTLKRSSRAKHARLEIRPLEGLTVVLPAGYRPERAQELVLKKQRWVINKLGTLGEAGVQRGAPPATGDRLPYLGRSMKIETRDTPSGSGRIHVGEDRLVVWLAPGETLHLPLEKWYREQAKDRIGPMVAELSRLMGLRYNRVTLKSQRTLWGSCSRKRNLNFNWRLIMTPEHVIEYVVIHELAHLRQMNHSPRFWQIVEKHCPAWRERRKWLREHSQELSRLLPA